MKIFMIFFILLFFSNFCFAQAENETTALTPIEITDVFVDDLSTIYSVKQISKQRLKATATTDVHRAIKESPGVYAREEDGLGLRPNIGLRGTNPDRSKKIVILEDQILIGPAPYSAPAAYYSPSMLTTENLEIYKGFTALPYGPNSIGGAINYKTHQFDSTKTKKIKVTSGSFNSSVYTMNLQHQIDETNLMLVFGKNQSDGFKKIDGGSKASTQQNNLLFKIQKPIQIFSKDHLFEIRLGYSDENSNETYLGLTENDYDNSYLRRYVSSSLDQMKWSHYKFQIEDLVEISPEINLRIQLYHHVFNRTWYRLDGFRDSTKSIQSILKSPLGANEPFYNILTGLDDSANIGTSADLNVASNERSYISQGLQSQFEFQNLYSANLSSLLKLKLLLHSDHIQRKHDSDYYSMTSHNLVRTADLSLATARNKETATAYSAAAQEEIKIDQFIVSPQMRYEKVYFQTDDQLNVSKNNHRNDEIFISGLALGYEVHSQLLTKLSLNEAATLSGIDAGGGEKREESLNKEISIIWQNKDHHMQFEATYFENDYKNITGTCTASAGCTTANIDQQFNGGKALIRGFESRISKGFLAGSFWIPVQMNATFMTSEFQSSFSSTSPEWGVGQIEIGDPLPYVPTTLLNLVVGVDYKKIKQSISVNYFGKIYDQALAIGRTEIPSYGLLDYSANYDYSQYLNFKFKIDNILDKKYVAATKPFGYRPGKPQQFSISAEYTF